MQRIIVLGDGETYAPFEDLRVIEVPDEATDEDVELYLELSRYFGFDPQYVDPVKASDELTWRQHGYRILCHQDSLDDFIEGMLEVQADDAYCEQVMVANEALEAKLAWVESTDPATIRDDSEVSE